MSEVLQVIARGRELITPPEAFIQGHFALVDRNPLLVVGSNDPLATCWCAAAALTKAAYEMVEGPKSSVVGVAAHAADHLEKFTGGQTLIGFSDSHSHVEVLALFDRALEVPDA